MVKKSRAQRIKDITQEFDDHVQEENEDNLYAQKADNELFVIDKKGTKSQLKKIEKQKRRFLSPLEGYKISKLEEKRIEKVSKHLHQIDACNRKNTNTLNSSNHNRKIVDNDMDDEELWVKKTINNNSEKNKNNNSKKRKLIEDTSNNNNNNNNNNNEPKAIPGAMWGFDEVQPKPAMKKMKSHIQKAHQLMMKQKEKEPLSKLAAPGQSYNPSFEDHQDYLAEAVAVELKRQEAKQDASQPISKGLSKETLAIMQSDSSDSDSDSDSDEDDNIDIHELKRKKIRGKMTKAERNKQKRHREHMKLEKQNKNKKDLMKQASQIHYIMKDVEKSKKELEEKRTIRKELLAEKDTLVALPNEIDPKIARPLEVNLTEEIKGSLRQVKKAGSGLIDVMEGWQRRKQYEILATTKKTKGKAKVKTMERYR